MLVVEGRDLVDGLRQLLERADSQSFYRSGERLPVAVAIVPAARALVDLKALTEPVPTAEPRRDTGGPARASWITTQQAAEALGLSERAVRKRIAAGSLDATKTAGVWLINTEGLTNAAA